MDGILNPSKKAQTKSLSTLLANMDAKEAALGKLIPDAHKWHKQFTLTELQAVYDSVEKKLASLSGLTLEEKAKKFQFETDYVKDPSAYKHGATKYKTWEVSLSVYEKELAAVNYEIGVKSASLSLADAIQYAKAHPKMTKLAGLIDAAQKSIGLKADLADIDTAVAAAFFKLGQLTDIGMQNTVGHVYTDYAFASCGAVKGTGFREPVILNVYCPKGTRGVYVEPKSRYKSENKMLLQAGTKFRVVKAEKSHGRWYVDVEVIGYDTHPLL